MILSGYDHLAITQLALRLPPEALSQLHYYYLGLTNHHQRAYNISQTALLLSYWSCEQTCNKVARCSLILTLQHVYYCPPRLLRALSRKIGFSLMYIEGNRSIKQFLPLADALLLIVPFSFFHLFLLIRRLLN